MTRSISEAATDTGQYDHGEVVWTQEGHELSPIRRLFLEVVTPLIAGRSVENALDIGCGQGWLSAELAKHDIRTLGIDPSDKNIQAARHLYPGLEFRRSDLGSFETDERFDLVAGLMVFEHFGDLHGSYEKIRSLMKADGRLLMIVGDFDKYVHRHKQYDVEMEELAPDEVATRTDYGERGGVIYDINRTPERFIATAEQAGFTLVRHRPVTPPGWLIEEQPRYESERDKPLFHLIELALAET